MAKKKPAPKRKPAAKPKRKPVAKRKTGDASDPERRPGKNGFTMPIREDGEVEGKAHMWYMEEGEESLVLSEWHDGEITAYIERV